MESQSHLLSQCSLPAHTAMLLQPSCLSPDEFLHLSELPSPWSQRKSSHLVWNLTPQPCCRTCSSCIMRHCSHSHIPTRTPQQRIINFVFSFGCFLLIFPQLWKKTPESSLPLLDLILYCSFYLVKLHKHTDCSLSLHLLSFNCFHMLLQSVSSTTN